jgi:hypothetical protein
MVEASDYLFTELKVFLGYKEKTKSSHLFPGVQVQQLHFQLCDAYKVQLCPAHPRLGFINLH